MAKSITLKDTTNTDLAVSVGGTAQLKDCLPAAGASGASGPSGPSGASGATKAGASGASGTGAGKAGASGASGAAAAKAGPSGASGTAGKAGASGASGTAAANNQGVSLTGCKGKDFSLTLSSDNMVPVLMRLNEVVLMNGALTVKSGNSHSPVTLGGQDRSYIIENEPVLSNLVHERR